MRGIVSREVPADSLADLPAATYGSVPGGFGPPTQEPGVAVDDNVAIEEHVRAAQEAFWSVIAQRFPEVSTGDLPPEADAAFDDACHRAVWSWLGSNTGSLR